MINETYHSSIINSFLPKGCIMKYAKQLTKDIAAGTAFSLVLFGPTLLYVAYHLVFK